MYNVENTNNVVNMILYLMGGDCPDEAAEAMDRHKPAQTVRNLCLIRKKELTEPSSDKERVLGAANRLIDECIDCCARLFPQGVEWGYIRDLFVVPGEDNRKIAEAMDESDFTSDGYLHWPDRPWEWVDITASDKNFLRALYLKNGDSFLPETNLSDDAPEAVRAVHAFLDGEEKAVILVDCGKTDPFRFVSFLEAIPDADAAKLGKIQLFCDGDVSPTWKHMRSCVIVPVEYIYEPLTVEACNRYAAGTLLLAAGDNTSALAAQLPGKKTLALFTDPDLAKESSGVVLEDTPSIASDALKHASIKEQMMLRKNTLAGEKLEAVLSEAVQAAGTRLSDEEWEKFLWEYTIIGQRFHHRSIHSK